MCDRDPCRAGWARFSSLALLVVLTATAVAQDRPAAPAALKPAPFDRVREILDDLQGDPPRTPEESVKRLTGFGPGIVPLLLAVRDKYRGAKHVAVIADTLARLRSDRLEGYLVWAASGSPDQGARVVAWVKLGSHGTAFSLPHVLRLMAENEPKEKRPAERALTSILRRSESDEAYATVREFLRDVDERVLFRVVSCVASAGSRLSLPLLADQLGRTEDLDLVVVSGMARLPIKAEDESIVEKLRSLLASSNTNLRRECALALGIFKVASSVQTLIDLLADPDRGVKSNAHWSLCSISGLALPPDPHAWQVWFRQEQAWWKTEGKRFVELLESGAEGEVLGAIAMLAMRPLFREQVAPRFEALLESDSDRIREAAARALSGKSVGSDGGGGGGGGRSVLAGRKVARPSGVRKEDREDVGETEVTVGWPFYVVILVFILLFALYVLGALHPDRLKALLKRK